MKTLAFGFFLIVAAALTTFAQPALTIYNQNFAVVRDTVPLDLKAGVNDVRYADAHAHVEPDSVILRDRAGKPLAANLEQNYCNHPCRGIAVVAVEAKTIKLKILQQRQWSAAGKNHPGQNHPQPRCAGSFGDEL